MFHVPEEYRWKEADAFQTTEKDGNNGLFLINIGSDFYQCIASDGMGWEHVSVTIRTKNRKIYAIPTWEQMCYLKDLFWDDTDTVVQYHPKKTEYINNHPFVLHLWRPTDKELPIPESILVGIK